MRMYYCVQMGILSATEVVLNAHACRKGEGGTHWPPGVSLLRHFHLYTSVTFHPIVAMCVVPTLNPEAVNEGSAVPRNGEERGCLEHSDETSYKLVDRGSEGHLIT